MIREKLAKGGSIFGTWATVPSTIAAELLAGAGYDFIIVDTQHGGIAGDSLLPLLQTIDGKGVPALVRTTWTDQPQIMRALDLGAAGVVVPMVSTPEQAALAAQACRYPPHGIRSFGPVRSYYSADGSAVAPLCIVMAETAEALANIDAIAATPGVDGILIGPMDLALSMGFSVQEGLAVPDKVLEATSTIVAACRKHNILSASAAIGLANGKELVRRGVQLIAASADSLFIRAGAAADLKEMRGWQA
jgi:4-hydroxy-2-oxoheptanedioate aldolase